MNGQMQNYNRYEQSLNRMNEPILPSQLPKIKMNLAGLSRYAKSKDVSLWDLSEEEIRQFVPKV